MVLHISPKYAFIFKFEQKSFDQLSLRSISEERHLFREHFSEKANLLLLQITNFSTLPKNCIYIITKTGAQVFHILINT